MALADLPQLPAPHAELVEYIAHHPGKPMVEIAEPYRKYEAQLRAVFAQDRQNPILSDPYINVVPLFTNVTKHITVRARDLASESEEEKARYIMALPEDKRRPHGSPATVSTLGEFQKNFNIFSESSLAELDWSNVVAAGSSVVNTLLPVPDEFNTSKRKLREYYHDKFCPASDVDLFLYGLTHDEAIEKIKQIEKAVRDSILSETTVVRTKYAITIASQYPVRHVQIVLRVYKSVSEILTGFDIDAAGAAYDGKQVYVTPRALSSFITQINHIDLTRRSPSYENRLSKYSHRNFEVYWPELDRTRVDPTIFERSFQRTLGLARLLVLERLPTTQARETYLNKRRQERGRPVVHRNNFSLRGNIKGHHEDEIADWLSEEDISNYHTFSVPYGERFNAKRIEKLCYTRDLLLNAEWNQPKDREVYLHRHPAFFGRVEDVIEDCCGSCPKPVTLEEVEVAGKEAEIYISGKVSFLIDDPGRQQIGSFNPLTDQDWTDMAYVENTARLCQSIVDTDVDDVLNWLSQEGADPNQRDYTGRLPLHLAVMTSSLEIVRCLVDHGSRITARLVDGKTALHLAAARGNAEIIKILMEKSIENEEAEEERQAKRRQAAKIGDSRDSTEMATKEDADASDELEESSDGELIDGEDTETDGRSIATGSFVNVKKAKEDLDDDLVQEDEPDYYQIDVLAWDIQSSPLHLAIAGGHEDAVKLLCDYGADSILPVKFLNNNHPDTAAILTLTLALSLPREKAKSMALLLLKLGATSSQADSDGCTAFHRYVESGKMEMIDTLLDNDKTGVKMAINHFMVDGYAGTVSPLHTALENDDAILVLKMLNAGALAQIDFDTWLKSAKVAPALSDRLGTLEDNQAKYKESLEQPLIAALRSNDTKTAMKILENGADPNALTSDTESAITYQYRRSYIVGETVLDVVQHLIGHLRAYGGEKSTVKEPIQRPGVDKYLQKFEPGAYQHWIVSHDVKREESQHKTQMESYQREQERIATLRGVVEKRKAIEEAIEDLGNLERALIAKGGMKFKELRPDIKCEGRHHRHHFTFSSTAEDSKPTDFEHFYSFNHDTDMTETRRDGYIKLMEAAWTGDLETIKSLTLQAWGSDQEQTPLKMAITDNKNNSPFSLAFLRGHYEAARAILEIVKAQWSPPEKDQVRYKMQGRDEDEDEDGFEEEEDEDSDSEPRIVSETVDKKFTIDDIGQVSMQVKSHTKPLTVICDAAPDIIKDGTEVEIGSPRSLFVHVMDRKDTAGLKILLEMAQQYAGQRLAGDEDEFEGTFTFPQEAFLWAVLNGKTQSLGLIIKRTGAGIPLDHLVKKSGVEMKQKPRYYQGLTVYGKKRKDWATAGRNMVVKTSGLKTPPLLHAAMGGHIEGVEFFLSDTPHRLYGDFSKSKAGCEDSRLKHLKDSPGGFDRAISKWLGADNELVMHCALLATPSENSIELLKYLIEACPECLEKKTSQGDTPLMIACRLGRSQYVKLLVEANADQSTRNHKGENILHAALAGNPTAARLRRLLELLDPDLGSHLFVHRKNLQENATTPLHAWVSQACGVFSEENSSRYYIRHTWKPYKNEKDAVEVVKLLLEYSKGEELDMLNGAGDTCLHTAIMYDMISIVKALVDFKPRLLYRENAVGRTPAELAHDRFTGVQFARPTRIMRVRNLKLESYSEAPPNNFIDDASVQGLTAEQLREKVAGLGLSDDYEAAQVASMLSSMGTGASSAEPLDAAALMRAIWDLCQTAMEKNLGKRRLVSLNEANDVARRLGEKHTGSRYFSIQARGEDDGEKEEEEKGDFASSELGNNVGSAWEISEYEAKEYGIDKCEKCDKYHE